MLNTLIRAKNTAKLKVTKRKYLPRTVDQVMNFSKAQITQPSQDWSGLCQSHCRKAYGVKAWAPSAYKAWLRIPNSEKIIGGKPEDAPRGAILYYKGGKFGHAALKTRKAFKALSNDYRKHGQINYAPVSFAGWGLTYLGCSNWTPEGELRLV